MHIYVISVLLVVFLTWIAEGRDYKELYLPSEELASERGPIHFPRCRHTPQCRLFFVLAVIVLVFVGGLRYHVGTDYWTYEGHARMYAESMIESIFAYNEPGIRIIAKVASLFSQDFAPLMFLLATLITVGLYAITIYRYSRHLLMAMLLLVLLGCWADSFNAVRQCLAASVFFCSIPYIQSRDFKRYAIVVFVASLFHKTALGLFPLFFLAHKRVNLKNLLIMLLAIAAYFGMYDYIMSNVSSIMEVNSEGHYVTLQVNIFRVMVGCTPGLIAWLFFQGKQVDDERVTYINLMLVHMMVWIMASQSAYLARFAIYTTPFLTLGITRCLDLLGRKERQAICYLIVVLYFAFWWHEIDKSSNLRVWHWIWER